MTLTLSCYDVKHGDIRSESVVSVMLGLWLAIALLDYLRDSCVFQQQNLG